jgi:hypothetical protein
VGETYVVISVVHVNVLGLTLCININLMVKFIYTPCKCKNQYIYIVLHGYVKQFKY